MQLFPLLIYDAFNYLFNGVSIYLVHFGVVLPWRAAPPFVRVNSMVMEP